MHTYWYINLVKLHILQKQKIAYLHSIEINNIYYNCILSASYIDLFPTLSVLGTIIDWGGSVLVYIGLLTVGGAFRVACTAICRRVVAVPPTPPRS